MRGRVGGRRLASRLLCDYSEIGPDWRERARAALEAIAYR